MAYSEDHIALAAEYALGTLDAGERAQVETMMAVDAEFGAIVQAWEFRLGALNQMVGTIEPRPIVWENIKAAIANSTASPAPQVLPEPPSPPPAPPVAGPVATPVAPPVMAEAPPAMAEAPPAMAEAPVTAGPSVERAAKASTENSNVILLAGRAKRWRNVASVATALAAALVAMLAVQVYRPDILPEGLRPKPRIQTVEVRVPAPPAAPSAQYVALLQGSAGAPAFILTVDAATKNFTVRKVGAEAERGKSFELWLISDRLPQPRSLGVIGGGDFTARPVLAGFDAGTINGATYAVTVEPAGGSPTGQPTSAPVYTGKLIETVPAR